MVINLLLALITLLICSAIFSAAETSFTSLSIIQIKSLESEGSSSALRVVRLMKKPEHLLGTILIGNNIANISAGSLVTMLALELGGQNYVAYATGILTLFILIFSEVSPKQFAISHNEGVAKTLGLIILPLSYLLWPLVWFVSLFGRLMNRISGGSKRKVFAMEGLFHMMNLGEEEGEVDPYEKSVVRNVFRLSDNTAMSALTHRKDVFSLAADLTLEEAIPTIIKEGFSRIPVYGQSQEDIVGIVMQRDIFKYHVEHQDSKTLRSIMLKPLFVPASMRLDELVDVFKREPLNLAVALDEYGGLAGIVSREDVLEEILGELYDENEDPEIKTELLDDKSWRLQGETPIYWMEERLGKNINNDKHVNTISGHLIERLDRLPFEGEIIELEEGKFLVEKIERNRIVSLRFYPENKEVTL